MNLEKKKCYSAGNINGPSDDDNNPWKSLFTKSDNTYHGYITDLEAADGLVEEFFINTQMSYVNTKSTGKFSEFDSTSWWTLIFFFL